MIKSNRFLPLFFNTYKDYYKLMGTGGLMLMVMLWELHSFTLAGDPAPLAYIPFLNPLDLMQTLGFGTMLLWLSIHRARFMPTGNNGIYMITAMMILMFSTVMLARSIHFYADIPYTLLALAKSTLFQTSLSLLWSILAMVIMLLAKRLVQRTFWIVGATLMGIVVVKLFLVELSSSGTVERIVSFIAVGALLLLIGYFAPLPPVQKKKKQTKI